MAPPKEGLDMTLHSKTLDEIDFWDLDTCRRRPGGDGSIKAIPEATEPSV